MNEIIDRIGTIAADPGVAVNTDGKEPTTYEPETIYVFEDGDRVIAGAESGPPSQESFDLLVVYMAKDWGEEARQERIASVTAALSSRRDTIIDRLQAVESCDLWAHIAVTSDADFTSNFEGRAIAVRIQGYRYL